MCIGQYAGYKGYIGSIEYDIEEDLYYGFLLNTNDHIGYHSKNILALYEHYKKAIDLYLNNKESEQWYILIMQSLQNQKERQ